MATTFTVSTTQFPELGYVLISWTNAGAAPNHYSYRVYRRLATGPGAWELIHETFGTTPFTYKDYRAAAQTSYQYAVVQVTNPGAVITEEAKVASTATGPLSTIYYWLIHPTDETLTMNFGAAEDQFTEEYDETVHKLIGRGRKIDVGTNYGKDGSLTLKLRDKAGLTAREQRLKLELLKATQTYFYLKNPFGDVDKVALGKIQITRLSGLGIHEAVDATVPYFEVA